ncbi:MULTISPECIES: hypothetical protein [unclassified Streptomyces]
MNFLVVLVSVLLAEDEDEEERLRRYVTGLVPPGVVLDVPSALG